VSYDSEQDLREHIFQVAARLQEVCRELQKRGELHDASKLDPDQKPVLDAVLPTLQELVYGTDEYNTAAQSLAPAMERHYAKSSHHAQHYANGIAGMDLIDLIEMYCDWAAATLRTKNGELDRSSEINIKRYGISDMLGQILKNTRKRYGGFCGQPELNRPIEHLKG
jgi:hypothetical protein